MTDFDEWVDKMEESSSYLSQISMTEIQETKRRVVETYCQNEQKIEKILNSLENYRFVDEIKDLHLGKHIRWIRIGALTGLTNGGIVLKLSFLAKGTYIHCKNGRTIMQYNFDDCYTFQKLSAEEHLILLANSFSANSFSANSFSANSFSDSLVNDVS
jgi:hypothetical protein